MLNILLGKCQSCAQWLGIKYDLRCNGLSILFLRCELLKRLEFIYQLWPHERLYFMCCLYCLLFNIVSIWDTHPFLPIFIVDTITDGPIFPPFLTSTQSLSPRLPSGHHHTIVCVYGLCIYVILKMNLFPALTQSQFIFVKQKHLRIIFSHT